MHNGWLNSVNAHKITRNIWHAVGGLKLKSQLYSSHVYPIWFESGNEKWRWEPKSVCSRLPRQTVALDIYCTWRSESFWCWYFLCSPKECTVEVWRWNVVDMINKQQSGVNVCSYTHWMTGCNWLQPVWCNKAHYYVNPASPSDSNVLCCVCVTESARGKRDNQVSARRRLGNGVNEWLCQCDGGGLVCTPVCPIEKPWAQKLQPAWSPLLSQHCLSSGWHLKTSSWRTKD